HRIYVTVVTTLELDDLAAARHPARQTQSTHNGLRAAAHKTDHFDVPVMLQYEFPDQIVVWGRGAKRHSFGNGGLYPFYHGRMHMAQDQRPPGATEIHKHLIINVV